MTIAALVLVVGVCFLAYSNGSNDNFKGVATLFGSGTTNYRRALAWATATTFAGSICSIFLAETLVRNFSGKGLVPDSVAGSPEFLQAVVLGAGLCVMLATVVGFPISTTHSLTGALVGAGFMAVGGAVNVSTLKTATCHEDAKRMTVVVTPRFALSDRQASEFAGPDHQHFIQHASPQKVED